VTPAGAAVPLGHLGAFQRAVRALLTRPVLTPAAEPVGFGLVRRFRVEIAAHAERTLGAHLEVTATSARLRRPTDRFDPHLRLSLPTRDLDRRRLAYLCLALAALSRVADVVTLTDLAATVRPWADETPRLGFDETRLAHRRAFADALSWLEACGGVAVVDATTAAWAADPGSGEVLYQLDHDVLRALVDPPALIDDCPSAAAFLSQPPGAVSRAAAVERRRQRLARLLVDHPVVHYGDLEPADAELARRDGGRLAEELNVLTGWVLERRSEGLALTAPTGTFPRTGIIGTVAVAVAVELATAAGEPFAWPSLAQEQAEVVQRLDAAGGRTAVTAATPTNETPLATAVSRAAVVDLVRRLVEENAHGLGAEHRADPDGLADSALHLLASCDLVRLQPGAVVPLPALQRYRSAAITRSRPAPPAAAEKDNGDPAAPQLFEAAP